MFQNNFKVETSKKKKFYYISDTSYQKSKDEIMSTMQINIPYTLENWKLWAPKTLDTIISAGVFDLKKILTGRTISSEQQDKAIVSEVADCGWRLKQPYTGDEYEGDIRDVFKMLIEQAGLIAIIKDIAPEIISRTTIWASSSDSSSDVDTSGGCITVNHKHTGVKPAEPEGAKSWQNYCPLCKAVGKLQDNPKKAWGGEVTCGACGADYDGNNGWDKTWTPRDKLKECTAANNTTTPTTDTTTTTTDSVSTADATVDSSALSSLGVTSDTSSSTSTSTEVQIEEQKTYDDELKQICSTRDYHYFVTPNNECVVCTAIPPLKADFEIKPYMMKYGTFKFNGELEDKSEKSIRSNITISTVAKISYNNGVAIVKLNELYDMYGEVNPIVESQPTMHRDEAEKYGHMKLVQALRDSGIQFEFEMLLTGEVYPGRWVGIINPKTKSHSIVWVDSITIKLDPEDVFNMSVKCLYMPKVSETTKTGSADPKSLEEIGTTASQFKYSDSCQKAECIESSGGDCWAMSDWIYKKCISAGIQARIVQYPTSMSARHRSVLINQGSGWVDFPYRSFSSFDHRFYNTSGSAGGTILK